MSYNLGKAALLIENHVGVLLSMIEMEDGSGHNFLFRLQSRQYEASGDRYAEFAHIDAAGHVQWKSSHAPTHTLAQLKFLAMSLIHDIKPRNYTSACFLTYAADAHDEKVFWDCVVRAYQELSDFQWKKLLMQNMPGLMPKLALVKAK